MYTKRTFSEQTDLELLGECLECISDLCKERKDDIGGIAIRPMKAQALEYEISKRKSGRTATGTNEPAAKWMGDVPDESVRPFGKMCGEDLLALCWCELMDAVKTPSLHSYYLKKLMQEVKRRIQHPITQHPPKLAANPPAAVNDPPFVEWPSPKHSPDGPPLVETGRLDQKHLPPGHPDRSRS